MTKPLQIAIDGTAASGKTTVGKIIAKRLNYKFLDTGVMYRVVALAALEKFGKVDDELTIIDMTEKLDICLSNSPDDESTIVYVDGRDCANLVHTPEVDRVVSIVAAYPGVRRALTAQQRKIGLKGGVVMVGRDIGTVVMPDAALKIYLAASAEKRAERRFRENMEKGIESDYNEILKNVRKRDQIDSTRELAPLKPAEDALVIYTDNISAEEVADQILNNFKD